MLAAHSNVSPSSSTRSPATSSTSMLHTSEPVSPVKPANPVRIYPSAHRVGMTRYATSTDRRGYIPVFEYALNGQYIMIDCETGLVHFTGIWKALGHTKADVVKLVESDPNIAPHVKKVRGGYLKIQGTWLPYETALTLARRVAWHIRYDLIPLFGPAFPDTCLSPTEPGFGQLLLSAPKLRSRRMNRKANSAPVAAVTLARPNTAGSAEPPPRVEAGPVRTFRTSPAVAYAMPGSGYSDHRHRRFSPYGDKPAMTTTPQMTLEPLQPLHIPGASTQKAPAIQQQQALQPPPHLYSMEYRPPHQSIQQSYDSIMHELPVGNALPSMKHISLSGSSPSYDSVNQLNFRWFGSTTNGMPTSATAAPHQHQHSNQASPIVGSGMSMGYAMTPATTESGFSDYSADTTSGCHNGLRITTASKNDAFSYSHWNYSDARRPSSAPESVPQFVDETGSTYVDRHTETASTNGQAYGYGCWGAACGSLGVVGGTTSPVLSGSPVSSIRTPSQSESGLGGSGSIHNGFDGFASLASTHGPSIQDMTCPSSVPDSSATSGHSNANSNLTDPTTVNTSINGSRHFRNSLSETNWNSNSSELDPTSSSASSS